MNDPKYIMIMGKHNFETPIIFPNHMQHVDMMRRMGLSKKDIISAGFVMCAQLTPAKELESGFSQDVKHTCYGESFSIGVESRKEDSDIVDRMYFGK